MEDFEEFTGLPEGMPAIPSMPEIAIVKFGIMRLNEKCCEELGFPDDVDLFFNKKQCVIAVRRGNRMKVSWDASARAYSIDARDFMEHYHITIGKPTVFPVKITDGTAFLEVTRFVEGMR